ncbi:MAG TPA: preprotein translocase subunit SecE [Actinomycetes bacterium]|nr:preprotein translocase subunit SecE [Actinomycetes bacterium]
MSQTRGSTATPAHGPSGRAGDEDQRSLFARLSLYYRQIVAELRKVIWPTRKELINYTAVVIVFVLIVIAYVSVLDVIFGRVVLAIFG